MSRLFITKSYIRQAFNGKFRANNAYARARTLFKCSPGTRISTYWYLFLSAYVNELSPDATTEIEEEENTSIGFRFDGDDEDKSYSFNELNLSFSTVGYLPEQVNYYYVMCDNKALETTKKIFASYLTLLYANYADCNFQITGLHRDEKAEIVVHGFENYYTFVKGLVPDNPMFALFDICNNSVRVNSDGMLSFDVGKIIDFFKDNLNVDLTRSGFKNIEYLRKVDGVDILDLIKNADKLYPEDIEYFIAELETSGNYDPIYVIQCKNEIEKLTKPKTKQQGNEKAQNKNAGSSVFVSIDDLHLEGTAAINAEQLEANKRNEFISKVTSIRQGGVKRWEAEFESYIKNNPIVTPKFIKENASFFKPLEFNVLLTKHNMDEEFLEQYFSNIDPVVIACHQYFSEAFFMKHFNELNYNNVLKKGINDWRLKENRSKKLDVFLRLKGVSI